MLLRQSGAVFLETSRDAESAMPLFRGDHAIGTRHLRCAGEGQAPHPRRIKVRRQESEVGSELAEDDGPAPFLADVHEEQEGIR